MSDNTFTDAEMSMEKGIEHNYANTSIGESIVDDIDYSLPTDDFDIVGVVDNGILGEIYTPNVNDKGEVVSSGGIITQIDAKKSNEKNLYVVMHVQMVGREVKEVKVGDYVVVSKTAGLKRIDFNGRESAMTHEKGVFLKVKPKK